MPPYPPRQFFEPSVWQTLRYLVHGVALALLPGLMSLAVYHASLPWLLAVSLISLLSLVGGYGFFMLAGTAHEGFHFTLHKRPLISAAIGLMFSAIIPGFIAVGFMLSHWKHHRYTNTLDDPDLKIFGRFRNVWMRMFLARFSANAAYRRAAWQLLHDSDEDAGRNGLSLETLRTLTRFNIAWHLMLMAGLVALAILQPAAAVFVYVLPLVGTVLVTGLNPYQEHVGTGLGLAERARSRTSPIFTFLMSGTNYHLEHHLYPRVPCWRLPSLHRWLRDTDWYKSQQPLIETTFWRSFSPRLVSSQGQYGATSVLAEASPQSGGATSPR